MTPFLDYSLILWGKMFHIGHWGDLTCFNHLCIRCLPFLSDNDRYCMSPTQLYFSVSCSWSMLDVQATFYRGTTQTRKRGRRFNPVTVFLVNDPITHNLFDNTAAGLRPFWIFLPSQQKWLGPLTGNKRQYTLWAEPPRLAIDFLSKEKKRGFAWIASNLWSSCRPNFWSSKSCLLSSNWSPSASICVLIMINWWS